MTSYFLGIDIGATKTDALIADDTGRALGLVRVGPGNHQTVGYDGMASTLRDAIVQVLSMAAVPIDRIEGAGFGIAGYDWPSQHPRMLETIHQAIELNAPMAVSNDAVLGLLAGTGAGWGVALVAQLLVGWTLWGLWLGGRVQSRPDRQIPRAIVINAIGLLLLWAIRLLTGTLPPA